MNRNVCLLVLVACSAALLSWSHSCLATASVLSPADPDLDVIYRLVTADSLCNDEHCPNRQTYKRTPNELVINRDSLVTLLRHMYPKAAFSSPFLGKRSWLKPKFDGTIETR